MKQILWLIAAAGIWLYPLHSPAADVRADFLKIIDRPKVALDPQVETVGTNDGIVQFHFTYVTEAGQRVPGILLKADGTEGCRPVVIAMHGTGGNKNDQLPLLRTLVHKGFIGVAIDGRYHGERIKLKGTSEYQDAILRAWRTPGEHPFFYDTVWDVMRLVDYLKTRDDVDPARIGLTGTSKGGVETYLTAAMDERIAVAVPCIGVQSFHKELEDSDWHGRIGTIQNAFDSAAKEAGMVKPDSAFVQQFYDKVVPGIYGEFDGPALMAVIAPRPFLMINSDSDNHTPMPGVRECEAAALKAYQAAHAEDHFVLRIQEHTGHKVTAESERATVDWFEKWLKP